METQNNARRLIVSEWTTLDGVFDAATMKEWFEPFDSTDRQNYIRENVMTSGAFLVGRVTYEMFASYWPNQKHDEMGIADRLNSAPKYVVSSTLMNAEWNNSTIIDKNVVEEIAKLKQQPGQDIMLFGSALLVQSLMKTDLIDEYRFLVHPIVMGSGKRFFRDEMVMTKMRLTKTKTLNLGVIVDCYQPMRMEQNMPQSQAARGGRQ
jgi:dihydrofolate reductase